MKFSLPDSCILFLLTYYLEFCICEKKNCLAPNITLEKRHELKNEMSSDIHEIEFKIAMESQKFEYCKYVCSDLGHWMGPFCRQENETTYKPLPHGCQLHFHSPFSLITHNHQIIQIRESTYFSDGTELQFRCVGDPGTFYQDGNSTLKCINGNWDSKLPSCLQTSTQTKFSEFLSPQIHLIGNYSVIESTGEIALYPGSILHMDCIYYRKLGNPVWSWTKNSKMYPSGWHLINEEHRNWVFRISLYYAKPEDSNTFTCKTPNGQINSVKVIVTDVECSTLKVSDVELESRLESHRIGSFSYFSCPSGYHLIGPPKLTCLLNGSWSDSAPRCEAIHCSPLEILDSHLRLLSFNNSISGIAVFMCPFAYKIVGSKTIICEKDGKWSDKVPTCKAIECLTPLSPKNGLVEKRDIYYVGTTVEYSCDSGHILIGEPLNLCTYNETWSYGVPYCKKACSFPGNPSNGRISPLKFLYEIGDKIQIHCNTGWMPSKSFKLICYENGLWSHHLPDCISIYNSF